jgi:hypothetical protein
MKGSLRQIQPMQGLGGSDMVKLAQGQRLHPIQRGGHLVKKPVPGFEIAKIQGRRRAVGLKPGIHDVDPRVFRKGKRIGRNLKAPLVLSA